MKKLLFAVIGLAAASAHFGICSAAEKRPVVIVACGRAADPMGGSASFAADLTGRGYLVVPVEVGKGPFVTPAAVSGLVQTVSQAVTRGAADPGADTARIGLFGYGPAGGAAAFYAGLADPRVRAVVTGGFGYGRDLWPGKADADIIRAAGDKPVLFLVSKRDGDRSALSRVLNDRKVCKEAVRRWTVWDLGDKLPDYALDDIFAFADLHVRDRSVLKPAYPGGRIRLLDRDVKIGGKTCHVVRIPAIAVTPNGTVILAADARFWNYGDLADYQPTRTVIRRSKDNGRTWSEPALTVERPWNDKEQWSLSDPSLVVDRQANKVFCFVNGMEFVRGRGVTRLFVQESTDDGATWSPQREITEELRWPGVDIAKPITFITSGHGIQASDGTLLHVKTAQRFGVHLFGSDDHGRTWKIFGNPTMGRADESKVEILADGTWLINSRDSFFRTNHRSTDRGKTWISTPNPQLTDSITNGGILRVPLKDGGEALLICHSHRAARPRMNLTVRASRDGGRTWNEGVVIDPGHCEYSDMVQLPDGRIGIVYEAEGERAIDFVAVPLEEIL